MFDTVVTIGSAYSYRAMNVLLERSAQARFSRLIRLDSEALVFYLFWIYSSMIRTIP